MKPVETLEPETLEALAQKMARTMSDEERDIFGDALRARDEVQYARGQIDGIRAAAARITELAIDAWRGERDAEADRLRALSKLIAASAGEAIGPSADRNDASFGLLYGIAEDEIEEAVEDEAE